LKFKKIMNNKYGMEAETSLPFCSMRVPRRTIATAGAVAFRGFTRASTFGVM